MIRFTIPKHHIVVSWVEEETTYHATKLEPIVKKKVMTSTTTKLEPIVKVNSFMVTS